MTQEMKIRLCLTIAGILGFFMLLGWAGRMDYNEQVVLRMPQEVYDEIVETLTVRNGSQPSQSEIVAWYDEHYQ